MRKIIRCIDVETTSTKEPPASAVCEIGWCDVLMEEGGDGRWSPHLGDLHSTLINPGVTIEPEARAVHHIGDGMVARSPTLDAVIGDGASGVDFLAAHSSAYEKGFLGAWSGRTPWICTLKASRRVWPDAPAHSLQVLRYWRGLDAGDIAAHRAGPDAYLNALLLIDLINSGASVREMVAWEQMPSLLPGLIKFGKHKGVAWKDAPGDYLDWIASKSDMDEDTKFTARHWLQARAA